MAAAAAAMALLAQTDAVIIDVRYAPGGDVRMVDMLASYFFDTVTPTLATDSLSVSIGRTFNPKTNQGWEGTGVQPDVRAPAADALDAAHRLAVAALIEAGGRAEMRLLMTDGTEVPYPREK